MLNRLLWPLMRFCLCAWVGGAALFVITGVNELRTTEFDAMAKNHLVVLKFPAYYCFGGTLTLGGCLSALLLARQSSPQRRKLLVIAALCATSLAVMAIDHATVYEPLEAMMTRPDHTIDPDFWTFHRRSKNINIVTLSLVLIASILAVQQPSSSMSPPPPAPSDPPPA